MADVSTAFDLLCGPAASLLRGFGVWTSALGFVVVVIALMRASGAYCVHMQLPFGGNAAGFDALIRRLELDRVDRFRVLFLAFVGVDCGLAFAYGLAFASLPSPSLDPVGALAMTTTISDWLENLLLATLYLSRANAATRVGWRDPLAQALMCATMIKFTGFAMLVAGAVQGVLQ
jgi:hypothetical protein